MKENIKNKASKKIGAPLCFIIIILLLTTLTGCSTDQGDNYLQSQKRYLNYTFQSKDWNYTTGTKSNNSSWGLSSEYAVNTIYYTDSNGDEDTFDLDTSYSGYTYTMAVNIYNKMSEIMEEDISPLIEKYADLNSVHIFTDYESLSSTARKRNNYNDSDDWAEWLVNSKKGVKLYNIYEFAEKNLKATRKGGGYIILNVSIHGTDEEKIYDSLKNSINSIYESYSNNIGFYPNMEIIVSGYDMDDLYTEVYFKNGKAVDCDSEEEYYKKF